MSRADRERLAAYMEAVMTASEAAGHIHNDEGPCICDAETECDVEGHDFQPEDIADGVVGGGLAHVYRIYCTRCGEEGEPEDLDA